MRLIKRILMRTNALIRRACFSRRALVRALFRVELVAGREVQSYCEWATILFRWIVPRYLAPGRRVLDLGTGAHAVVAIFAKKKCPGASVMATDLVPERAAIAARTIAQNHVQIDCIASSLFDAIDTRFDLVLFNPPIIPSDQLASLGYTWKKVDGLGERRCWSSDGGHDGLQIIRPFLRDLPGHLTADGVALVLVNPVHCPPAIIHELCDEYGLVLHCTHRIPSVVTAYVLAARPAMIPSKRSESFAVVSAALQEGGCS
jgi:hypothetical protein